MEITLPRRSHTTHSHSSSHISWWLRPQRPAVLSPSGDSSGDFMFFKLSIWSDKGWSWSLAETHLCLDYVPLSYPCFTFSASWGNSFHEALAQKSVSPVLPSGKQIWIISHLNATKPVLSLSSFPMRNLGFKKISCLFPYSFTIIDTLLQNNW